MRLLKALDNFQNFKNDKLKSELRKASIGRLMGDGGDLETSTVYDDNEDEGFFTFVDSEDIEFEEK